MRANFVTRVRILAWVMILVALVCVARLYGLQIVDGAEFRARAEGQYTGQGTFDRGSIFFTDKDGVKVGAATLASGATVAIIPLEITDPSATLSALETYLPLDHTQFLAKASKVNDPYEEIARRVPELIAVNIASANIPGVRVIDERWRFYPGATAAAHTIGVMGYADGERLMGQYGLERFYDDVLSQSSDGLSVNFFADLFANVRTRLFSGDVRAGGSVVTTIEPTVQGYMEDMLDEYTDDWHPKSAGAIVLDPVNGAVIAFAVRPTFDPNDTTRPDASALGNPLVENVYEFGSIMKPLTIAAGIDEGVITPESTYTDRGFAVYDGSTIQNFDGKARGANVSMQEVLNQSLNTGAAYVAVEKLGPEKFKDYVSRYGLLGPSGIDLPNEADPLVTNLDSPRSIEYATASFGQGFAVTPLAMARALATLANHGRVPNPHLATALEYPGMFPTKIAFGEGEQAISPATTDTVSRMLVHVVDHALRDGAVRIPELSVAAKTGTAQIAQATSRGYYTDRYLHSFFGYFPAYDARFLIFLYAVEPQGARYASETWTTPFIDSVKFLMTYYDIEPDRARTEP